ncbi:MAG TPA: hypothetical protein VKT28_22590 [Puia sp.]|nr:hypothetical protein [Puia sp.]
MKKIKFLLLASAFCFSFFSFSPPTDPVSAIRQILNSYYRNYPEEKVYVQFDKQQYLQGEHIWLKGYVAHQSKPSLISKIVYVELFNSQGFIIKQLMLSINESGFSGEILVPEKMASGNYYIRAYTAWMLNFNSSLFFYKKILIGKEAAQKKVPKANADFTVQFFPESGHLVQGLTSLIAFKAEDSTGTPLKVSGKIINNYGETVALVSSDINGLGSFVMHSWPSTEYSAVITANGITKKIPLPAAEKSGIVLHVETRNSPSSDSIFFNISRSRIEKEKYKELIVCAQMESRFSVMRFRFDELLVGDPADTLMSAPCPLLLNNFGEGVLHLSVLDLSGNMLAERLVFAHDTSSIHDQVTIEQLSDKLNEKSNFSFRVPDNFQGALSVSITDADKIINPDNEGTILTGLLLPSGIHEFVNLPQWCLKDALPETSHQLDLLLLTSKWAGYDWKKIMQNEYPEIKYLPEQSIALRGKAFELTNEKKSPLKNGSLFLVLKNRRDSLTKLLNVLTDSLGEFTVTGLSFHDTANLYVQTGEKTEGHTKENITVEFYKNIIDSISQTKFAIAPFLLNFKKMQLIEEAARKSDSIASSRGSVLKSVTVHAKTKTHVDSLLSKYASGIFANSQAWASTMDFTDDPITKNLDINVLDYLNGKIAGVTFTMSDGQYLIYWRFSSFIQGLTGPQQLKLNSPSFFLNENLLNVGLDGYDEMIQILSNIRIADVAMVRVFQPGKNPMVPNNGPNGSIAIYLKNGTENDRPDSKISFQKSNVTGFNSVSDFNAANATTLYWNPSLNVDAVSHKATISFTNNSSCKRLRIIAEGMDKNGMIVRINKIIE